MKEQKKAGFTLVEIMIVVAIIGLLAAIAIPSFMKSRQESQRNACINNMRQIDSAKEQAAMAYGWTNGTTMAGTTTVGTNTVTNLSAVVEYIKAGAPTCPANGSYTYNAVGSNPVCTLAGTPTLHVLPR